jgi:hypothetical protein
MAHKMTIRYNKTYSTEENADKAVEKIFGDNNKLRYFLARTEDGRFFPIFVGMEAISSGVHFHFNVVG